MATRSVGGVAVIATVYMAINHPQQLAIGVHLLYTRVSEGFRQARAVNSPLRAAVASLNVDVQLPGVAEAFCYAVGGTLGYFLFHGDLRRQ